MENNLYFEMKEKESINRFLYQIEKISKIFEEEILSGKNRLLSQKATVMILIFLNDKNGLSQRELSDMCYMKGSTISVSLKILKDLGFVEIIGDSNDKRVNSVFITEKGRDYYKTNIYTKFYAFSDIFEGLTPKEISNAKYVLDKIITNIDKKNANL